MVSASLSADERRLSLPSRAKLAGIAAGPVLAVFISSNIANAGNLAYNMLFSRWMGPELFGDLALLLTIKLSVLAVLNSVQFAVSRDVACRPTDERILGYGRMSRVALIWGFCLLPILAFTLWACNAGVALRLSEPRVVFLLCAALPFAAPLCLARGVVTGRMSVRAIVTSTQVEVLVRLGGGALAWYSGYGIEGVTLAVALSIFAAWAVIAADLPSGRGRPMPSGMLAEVVRSSMPFAMLQAAQVALLDGDVLIAKLALRADEAGYAAALSLFQRIEFFACFALASVLLPSVTTAVTRRENPLRAAAPVAGLFAVVSLPVLAAAILAPDWLMVLLSGPAFLAAAPLLWMAAGSATAFTLSYLLATWLAALGDRSGIRLVVLCVPVQLGAVLAAAIIGEGLTLTILVSVKLVAQIALTLALAHAVFTSGALRAALRPQTD